MRSTTLFGIYTAIIVALFASLAGLTLYSLEKARWWDARSDLAQESYALHLKLEADVFRLFKQHADSLLIGDRDGGQEEKDLQFSISRTLEAIHGVIVREIQLVGEQEVAELGFLDEIEDDIRQINAAVSKLSASGEPIETFIQIERLAALLDGEIDQRLGRKIDAALEEEIEEVAEVEAEAAAFRARNERLVYVIAGAVVLTLIVGFFSFDRQFRTPIIRLRDHIDRLRRADYSDPVELGGSREFRELGTVLTDMGAGLAAREATRAEQKRMLEESVAARTRELHRLIDKLETGEENRKRLMADISHELRTPLAIILGEADVTLRTSDNLAADVADALARIRDSARHTNQIVDDMLTVARQEAGHLRLDRKDTDLRKIIEEAVSMFPRPVNVQQPDIPLKSPVDAVRLRQSILALLHNADVHGGPTIEISLFNEQGAHLIVVEDNGPGLSNAEKAQAFQRFFRGPNASGSGSEGSGLGLPLVKAIVTAHGGEIVLEDRETGGLRVRVILPQKPGLQIVPARPSQKLA